MPPEYNLGSADRIPLGEGRQFTIAESAIAVFRTRDHKLYAVQADCPHRGGPLADGILGSGRIVCPLHGYAFEVDTGRPVAHPCDALRTYPIEVDARGNMILTIEQGVPA